MPYTVRGTQVPVVIALASFLSPESITEMLGISKLQCLVVSSCLVCEFMTVVVVAWSALRLRGSTGRACSMPRAHQVRIRAMEITQRPARVINRPPHDSIEP